MPSATSLTRRGGRWAAIQCRISLHSANSTLPSHPSYTAQSLQKRGRKGKKREEKGREGVYACTSSFTAGDLKANSLLAFFPSPGCLTSMQLTWGLKDSVASFGFRAGVAALVDGEVVLSSKPPTIVWRAIQRSSWALFTHYLFCSPLIWTGELPDSCAAKLGCMGNRVRAAASYSLDLCAANIVCRGCARDPVNKACLHWIAVSGGIQTTCQWCPIETTDRNCNLSCITCSPFSNRLRHKCVSLA